MPARESNAQSLSSFRTDNEFDKEARQNHDHGRTAEIRESRRANLCCRKQRLNSNARVGRFGCLDPAPGHV
jgi:hypothetical protein